MNTLAKYLLGLTATITLSGCSYFNVVKEESAASEVQAQKSANNTDSEQPVVQSNPVPDLLGQTCLAGSTFRIFMPSGADRIRKNLYRSMDKSAIAAMKICTLPARDYLQRSQACIHLDDSSIFTWIDQGDCGIVAGHWIQLRRCSPVGSVNKPTEVVACTIAFDVK